MNDFKRIILERNSKRIFSDVTDPMDILTHLQSKHILRPHEVVNISNSPNPTAKLVNSLLHIKDGRWFEEFVEALSKDYNWISDHLKKEFYDESDAKIAFYLFGRGNVPPLPQHNVTRESYVQKLRQDIKSLKRDQYLVVHGLSGCGKTSLVVDSLNDMNLIENSLCGCVYWLSVGDFKNDDPDDLQCHQLLQKLCDMVNIAVHPQKDLLYQLRLHFSTKPDYDALLVLDDVSSPKVIKALRVGCKILVTTQDSGVMKEFDNKVLFSVNEGFTETESVQLLQDFVLDGPGELQPRIKDCAFNIHRVWKGHPMVIGLIGGVLAESKEEARRNQSKWKEYERKNPSLNDHENNVSRRRSIVEEQMSSIIELTLDKLDKKMKKLYEMLAVLVEDTNITLDVLKILWDLNRNEVRELMEHFYRRSLVFQKFNDDLNAPIYGIHNILMEHLKNKVSKDNLVTMHKDLITKYSAACNGHFAKLPVDNYIYSYLCHHIDEAKEWNEFRHQFFSLSYIESKLKATGPGDLLLDLHKYHTGLVGDDLEYSSKVPIIRTFVEKYGWDIHLGDIDVVQCALLEPRESFLYKEGANIASEGNAAKIYFHPVNIPSERPKELKKFTNAKCVCIITTNSANHSEGRILIHPNEDNHIAELDLNYRLKRRSFKVDSGVVKLKMSPHFDRFLSASSSGSVDIWNLTSNSTSNANTPPPSLRQRSYVSYFTEMRMTPSQSFKHGRRVTCACFSNDGKLVVSSSEDGTVCVWELESGQKIEEIKLHPVPYATACSFVTGDELIVICCQNFKIFFFNLKTKQVEHVWEAEDNYGGVLDVLCMPDEERKVILVQEKAVRLCMWEDSVLTHRREGPRRPRLVDFKPKIVHRESKKVTCAAYHKRHRLIIGTSDGCHLYFNVLEGHCPPVKFGSGEIKAVDMVGSRVAFAQHDVVKMCWPQPDNKSSDVNQPISFHQGWNNRDTSVYVTASANGIFQVFHDGNLIADRFLHDVCIIHVSTHGNHILVGTRQGQVMLFDVVSKNLSSVKCEFPSEIKYLSAEMFGGRPLYIAAAEQPNEKDSHFLQVVRYEGPLMRYSGINAQIVKIFLCRSHFLMVVLRNYSVMVWNLKSNIDCTVPVQEGRKGANVTDACLSRKEDLLVLSDQENCYHLLSLSWPENVDNLTNNLAQNVTLYSTPKLFLNFNHPLSSSNTDEVDGTVFSSGPCVPKLHFQSYSLSSASWCCCVCSKGDIVAFGCDQNEVFVRDIQQRRVLLNYRVFPNRRTNISSLKFSPYDIILRGKIYRLILFVVTDCLSLWDVSPFIIDNREQPRVFPTDQPECLACVKADGLPILDLSINFPTFKFSAFDTNGRYFLWKVWDT